MTNGPFHRTGVPGGWPAEVSSLPVQSTDGKALMLYDGGRTSEVELLRAVAQLAGVQWGEDEMGWWAAVPVDGPAGPS